MDNYDLPRGYMYRLEKTPPCQIIPGESPEPVVVISGKGGSVRYRLISYYLKRADSIVEDESLPLDDADVIGEWVWRHLPSLLRDAGVRKIIRFAPDSKCYYDSFSKTLYEANGIMERKGCTARNLKDTAEINGEPFEPTDAQCYLIERLTETPNHALRESDMILELEEHTNWNRKKQSRKSRDDDRDEKEKKNFGQLWYKIRRLDTSIEQTFFRGADVLKYTGSPPKWICDKPAEETTLTLDSIFNVVVTKDIVAIKHQTRQLTVSRLDSLEPEMIPAFFGLNSDLLDPDVIDMQRLAKTGYFDSLPALKLLLRRCSIAMEAVWLQIRDSITENLLATFSAATYYFYTEALPEGEDDLDEYLFPSRGKQWTNALTRVCPSVRELIFNTRCGMDFFGYCDTEVGSEKVVSYITALVLASFCYCHPDAADQEYLQLNTEYRTKLQTLIREKFDYLPPDSGASCLFDPKEFQKGLQDLLECQEKLMNDGLYAHAAGILRVYNQLKMSFNDENSLVPPSSGRAL